MNNNNKILDSVFDATVCEVVRDLDLQCKPYITYTTLDNGSPMGAVYQYQAFGFGFSQYVTGTTTDGEILIDANNLRKKQIQYAIIAKSKQAAIDYTVCALRHELYHVWQAEQGKYNGVMLSELQGVGVDSHGDICTEKAANNYMVKKANNNKQKQVALLVKAEEELPLLPQGTEDIKRILAAYKQRRNVSKYYSRLRNLLSSL